VRGSGDVDRIETGELGCKGELGANSGDGCIDSVDDVEEVEELPARVFSGLREGVGRLSRGSAELGNLERCSIELGWG
jgi:hypothetical protein